MLATLTDEMTSIVDARTGNSVRNANVVKRGGMMASYKRRDTETEYLGRGMVRIRDARDGVGGTSTKRVPRNTLDPLAAMAWLRFLTLEEGERAVMHTLDVGLILRVEAVGRGHGQPERMPSLVAGLGIDVDKIKVIEGTLTAVDRFDQPLPGRKSFSFRAWFSGDERGIPLVLESDLWMGVIRLQLRAYDPPR